MLRTFRHFGGCNLRYGCTEVVRNPATGLLVFALPGMSPEGPPGFQASDGQLLAAVAAAAPDQRAVWDAVSELLPLLLHATADGPLRGFSVDVETTGLQWRTERILELAAVDLTT
ncbi:hypothetical protein VOLCADRAFT_101402, partial [Volvox carteri f. nagariensis]